MHGNLHHDIPHSSFESSASDRQTPKPDMASIRSRNIQVPSRTMEFLGLCIGRDYQLRSASFFRILRLTKQKVTAFDTIVPRRCADTWYRLNIKKWLQ